MIRRVLLQGVYHIMMSFLTVVGAVAGVILFLTIAAKLAAEHLFAEHEEPGVLEGIARHVTEEGTWQEEEERVPVEEFWGLTKEEFEWVEAAVDSMELDPVFVFEAEKENPFVEARGLGPVVKGSTTPEWDDMEPLGPSAAECPDCDDCDCHGELPEKAPETWVPMDWFEPLLLLLQKHSDHNLGRLDVLEYRDRTCRVVDGRGKAGSWQEMEQILNRLRTMRIPHCVMCYPANDIGRPVEVLKWVPERS